MLSARAPAQGRFRLACDLLAHRGQRFQSLDIQGLRLAVAL